jgi:hypothetical protein
MNIRYNYVMAIMSCMGMRDLGHEKPLGLKNIWNVLDMDYQ